MDQLITDQNIEALVDHQLSGQDRQAVMEYLEKTPHAREKYQQLLRQKWLLKRWEMQRSSQ